MNAPQEDGKPLRAHLQQSATGFVPDLASAARLANAPALPPLCASVWAYFGQLHERRDYDKSGPKPLSWATLHAWQSVSHIQLDLFELKAILRIDCIFLDVCAEAKK